jgi:hypothetical protein
MIYKICEWDSTLGKQVERDATVEEAAAIEARGNVPPTVPQYTAAIQSMLDAKAQERHYDGILSACTYATSSVPSFAAEGQACVDWRDAVWSRSYELMAQVGAGTIPQPTIAALLAMLPAMAWPA